MFVGSHAATFYYNNYSFIWKSASLAHNELGLKT